MISRKKTSWVLLWGIRILQSSYHTLKNTFSPFWLLIYFQNKKWRVQSRRYMASIIETSADAIISKTLDGNILTWNQGAQKILGYNSEEIVGKHISILFPQALLEEEAVLMTKIKNNETVDQYDTIRVKKDGKQVPVSITLSPIKDRHGNIVGVSKVLRDNTIKEALLQERILLRTIIDNIPINIYAKNLRSEKILANKAEYEFVGAKTEQDVLGKSDNILYPNESAMISMQEDCNIFSGGKSMINEETFNKRKDGSVTWFLTSKVPFRNTQGVIVGLVGISVDITKMKVMEQTKSKYATIIEAKSKEMEQLTYIASHDLREPLLTIKNYIAILKEEYESRFDDNAKLYMESILKASIRMDELITGLLGYSRLGIVKEMESVDCNVLLKEVIEDLNALITSNDAKIVATELPTLSGYPVQLKLLFQNLISNAIKFKKKNLKPEIGIRSRKIKGGWEFEVHDNGIGIEQKNLEKIFNMFQRLHSRNEFSGNGIGLAHCKKITELHNGTIWVSSVPGVSSSFCFTILT